MLLIERGNADVSKETAVLEIMRNCHTVDRIQTTGFIMPSFKLKCFHKLQLIISHNKHVVRTDVECVRQMSA